MRLRPFDARQGVSAGYTAGSLLYDLVAEAASGGGVAISTTEIDENTVDANALGAVHERLRALGIDPQSCEFDFSKVMFADPNDGDPGHVLFFIGVERHIWTGGYVVYKGVILTKLESD